MPNHDCDEFLALGSLVGHTSRTQRPSLCLERLVESRVHVAFLMLTECDKILAGRHQNLNPKQKKDLNDANLNPA